MSRKAILEYTRFHGLTKDYSSIDLDEILQLSAGNPPDYRPLDLEVDLSSFVDEVRESDIYQSIEAKNLLSKATSKPELSPWRDLLPKTRHKTDLKIEIPLLESNHTRDIALSRLRPKRMSLQRLRSDFLSFEDNISEEDSNLGDVDLFNTLKRETECSILEDKIQVSRENLMYLSQTLKENKVVKEKRCQNFVQSDLINLKILMSPSPIRPLSVCADTDQDDDTEVSVSANLIAEVQNQSVEHEDEMNMPVGIRLQRPTAIQNEDSSLKVSMLPRSENSNRNNFEHVPDNFLCEEILSKYILLAIDEPPNESIPLDLEQFRNMSGSLDELDSIEDKYTLLENVMKPKKVVSGEKLLWKMPGLRVLDCEWDDDDSEIHPKRAAEDISTLSDVDENLTESVYRNKAAIGGKRLKLGSSIDQRPFPSTNMPVTSTLPYMFSVSNKLETFLDLRGRQFKNTKANPEEMALEDREDPIDMSQCSENHDGSRQPYQPRSKNVVQVLSSPPLHHAVNIHIPLPEIRDLQETRTVIFDSNLVRNRSLSRFLEENGGKNLKIIYRDLHSTPDIILNPKTCLIYTNVQAIMQRQLPGQGKRRSIGLLQENLESLSRSYDRIFVLISFSIQKKENSVHSNCVELTKFISFCSSFRSDSVVISVSPIWLVNDKTVQTSKMSSIEAWTWELITRYALNEDKVVLNGIPTDRTHLSFIQDETLWERFLREAGINPMAAQFILALLPKPEVDPNEQLQEKLAKQSIFWGLRKLAQMSSDERIDMFQEKIGRRIVLRLNHLFEGHW